jgi:hypothetical protein
VSHPLGWVSRLGLLAVLGIAVKGSIPLHLKALVLRTGLAGDRTPSAFGGSRPESQAMPRRRGAVTLRNSGEQTPSRDGAEVLRVDETRRFELHVPPRPALVGAEPRSQT